MSTSGGDDPVLDALGEPRPAGQRTVEHPQQRHAGDLGHAVAVELEAGQVGAQAHVDGQVAQLLEAGEPAAGRVLRQGDDDLIDVPRARELGQIVERAEHRAALDHGRHAAAAIVEQARDDDARILLAHAVDEARRLRAGTDQDELRRQPAGALPARDEQRGGRVQGHQRRQADAHQSTNSCHGSGPPLPDTNANMASRT